MAFQLSDQRSRVLWLPPPPGMVKINNDGSFLAGSGRAGLGVVFRSNSSDWVFGLSSFTTALDSLHAELLAFHLGLSCAWDRGHRAIICEMDSLETIQLINSGSHSPLSVIPDLIKSISSLMARRWKVEVHHIFREANAVADIIWLILV
ncbi:Ribonuclease H-like superfamily [Sesbania bispinosa]|nr:Ribonuclease H-like superfamily [Sesbania bispinosa]